MAKVSCHEILFRSRPYDGMMKTSRKWVVQPTWYGTSFTMIKNRSSLKMLQTHNLWYPSTILPSILRAYEVLFQRQLMNINRQLLSKKTTSRIFVHPIRCSACILELNNSNNQKKIPQFFHQKTYHSNQFDTFCIPKPRPRWLVGSLSH